MFKMFYCLFHNTMGENKKYWTQKKTLCTIGRYLQLFYPDSYWIFQEFFLTTKHILRTTPSHGIAAFQKWNEPEVLLNNQLQQCKNDVHKAFCGNFFQTRGSGCGNNTRFQLWMLKKFKFVTIADIFYDY